MVKPLALTLGEPAGIGPDIAIAAWLRRNELKLPAFYLTGDRGFLSRRAALLGFDVEREAFVATATAVALIVDGARIPVYLATQGADLATHWPLIVVLSIGAVVGTFAGSWALRRTPEPVFRRVVGFLLLVLGVYTLARAG